MIAGHAPVDLTDEQIANCRKLAAYLRTLPADYPDFEMSDFVQGGDYDHAHVACGTAACAVGHGPGAGIKPLKSEGWFDYSSRCFITDIESEAWDWCFHGRWSVVDNTAHGAAARIEYMLNHGLPDSAWKQRQGRAPRSYAVPA